MSIKIHRSDFKKLPGDLKKFHRGQIFIMARNNGRQQYVPVQFV